MLPQFFELDTEELSILEVKEGDTLKLGRHTLHFVMAPMVHWPEVMVEYDEADKILFSADGFGRFGALSQGCTYDAAGKAQDVLEQEWTGEARRYFINIVGKYGANVQGLLKKAAVLDIEKIAPLHGPVLTGGLEYFLDKYAKWSSYQPEEKGVVVAYSSIHGNTKHAAEHFASILEEQGEENVAVFDLARADMAQAVADSFRYDALVLAGITYDGGLMPCMEDFLYHLKMKNFQNRYAAVIENGSWGPVSGRLMKSYLENMKNITICEDMVTIRSVMKKADGQALEKLAEKVIKRS
jgi:flavorubredoxin